MVVVTLLVMLPLAVESPTSMKPPPALAETKAMLTIELAEITTSFARSVPPEIVVDTLARALAFDLDTRTAIAPTPKPDEEAVETSSDELPMSDFGPPTPTITPPPSLARSITRRWTVPPTDPPVKPMTRSSVWVPPIDSGVARPPNAGTVIGLMRLTMSPPRRWTSESAA